MSYVRFAMLLLVAGCRSIFGIHDPVVATDDANVDAASDATDVGGCTSFSSLFDTCALPAGVPMPGSVTAYSSDSGSITNGATSVPMPHVMVATMLGSIDVVSLTSFVQDPDGMLRITGALPVAFAVSGELEISGRVDLSAGGAGAGCDVTGTGDIGTVQQSAGDGGGGGGNIEMGADAGGGDAHPTVTHGGVVQPAGIHGGCAGGRAAGGSQAGGGAGGGALYLVAASTMLITGVIDTSGGGGKGSLIGNNTRGGGGGGGAGGLLMLEATGIDLAGQIDATGGGGGGGASGTVPGVAGKLGSAGGAGGHGSSGNAGGRGGNGTVAPVDGAIGPPTEGGGGGGGSVGRIVITSPNFQNAGAVAPPPS